MFVKSDDLMEKDLINRMRDARERVMFEYLDDADIETLEQYLAEKSCLTVGLSMDDELLKSTVVYDYVLEAIKEKRLGEKE